MMINGNLEMQVGGKAINFSLDNGPTFPVKVNLSKLFWLTATVGKNLPGMYAYNGTKWAPVTLSGPLYFSGNSSVPLVDLRIWMGTATVASGRWTVNIPAGIFTKIIHIDAQAGTSDATAAGGNFASVDLSTATITSISGTCNDAQPAGGVLVASSQFSPNGTIVQVTVVGQ